MDHVHLTGTRPGTDEMPTFMVGGCNCHRTLLGDNYGGPSHHKGRLRKCPRHTRKAESLLLYAIRLRCRVKSSS